MNADKNSARLPASVFILLEYFMPGGRQNCRVKARFIGNLMSDGVIIPLPLHCAINICFVIIC